MSYSPLLLLDKIIIEGYHFDDLPGTFEPLRTDGFGPRRTTMATVDNKRQVVVMKPPKTSDTSFEDKRKISIQAIRAGWHSPESIMGRCLYDHLTKLYSLQKTFYIQYDDVMTYDPSAPATCSNIGTQTRAYYTPTFPIKPFGWTPLAPTTWNRCVFINGFPVDTGSFTVDEDAGMIQFVAPLAPTDIVVALYTWRMYVQIAEFNVSPSPQDVAQEFYQGEVLFEQVKKPSTAPDYWTVTPPCADPSLLSFSAATPLSLVSQAINPSEYLSYGIFDSSPSNLEDPSSPPPFSTPNPSSASWPTSITNPTVVGLTETDVVIAGGGTVGSAMSI